MKHPTTIQQLRPISTTPVDQTNTTNKSNQILQSTLLAALCLTPLIGIYSPRALAYLPALIGLCGTIGFRIIHQQWPQWRKDIFIISAIVLSIIAISFTWTINPEKTIERLIKITPLLFGSALLFSLLQSMPNHFIERLRHYLSRTLIIAFIVLIFELLTKGWIFQHLHEMEKFTHTSFLNSSIVMICLIGLPLIISNFKDKTTSIILVLFLITMIFTDSQTVQLALLLGLPFLWKIPVSRKEFWVALGALIITLMLAAPWIAQFGFNAIAPLVHEQSWFADAYASSRLEIWNFVSERTMEKPFVGYGIEATRHIKDFNISNLYFEHDSVLHPHNFALQIWIEFGLLGAILSSGFIAYILTKLQRTAKHHPRAAKAGLAIFISILSMAATSYGLWQGWWLGTLLFTTALTYALIIQPTKSTG